MAAGIVIKKNGVLVENLRDSCVALTLNFIGGVIYDEVNKEINIPIQNGISVISNPPVGCKRIVNIYVGLDGKLAIDYEE